MSLVSLQEFVTILCDVITPPNQIPSQGQANVIAMSFGEGISREFVQKNQLPEDTGEKVGYTLASTLFNGSICFGYPKKKYDSIEQIIYSSSVMVQYYKSVDTFLSILPSFLTNYLNVTMDVIQKKKSNDFFSKTVNEFIEFFSIIQYLAMGSDLEQSLLPSEFGIPKIKDQMDSLSQKLLKCLQEGDQFRAMKEINQPSEEQESIFAKEIQELNDQVSKYRQLFSVLQNKITENFDSMFIEQAYADWQQYCKSVSDIIFSIFIISFEIAKHDPSQFTTIIQILEQLSNYAFLSNSPYIRLIRFRGNFEEYTKKSKEAHDKFGTIFAPLLQALINILPKCAPPFTEFSKVKITSLFTDLQRLYGEYDSQVENLVNALRADRRFSSFLKVGLGSSENPEIVEGSKGPLDSLLKIVSQLLKQKSTASEINETNTKFIEEFNKFHQIFTNFINKTDDINEKTRYIMQRDSYLSTFNKYVSAFQVFATNSSNNLLRTQAGLNAGYLLLSICHLDANQYIIKTLNSLFQLTGENQTQFLPANTKTLLDLLSLINSRAAELPQSAREIFLGLYPTAISMIRESSTVFSSNPDPKNPKNIGNCLHESDKLHPLLYSIYESINVQDLPGDLQGAAQLLSIFAFNIRYSADIYRNTYQIYVVHLLKQYSQLSQFVNFFSNYASKLGEQYYQDFISLKEKSSKQCQQLMTDCEKEPAFGFFDFQFLVTVKNDFTLSMVPSAPVVKKCIEIMKTINPPQIVKTMSNSITAVVKSLVGLVQFIDELFELRQLPILHIIGPLLDKASKTTTNDIAKLAEALQSNPSQASLLGNNLANSLLDFTNLMRFDDIMGQFSDQILTIAKAIPPTASHVTLGIKDEIAQLASALQVLNNLSNSLQPMFENYTNQLKALGKQKADELAKPPESKDPNVPVFPKGPGILVDPKTGQSYPGLLINQIPDSSMIDKLFMNAMQSPNDQMKNLLTNYVNAIKKDVDEFLPLFAEYQRNPTPELLAKLNALGSRILSNLKAYQDCLNFNPDLATRDNLNDLLNNFQDLPSASKVLSAPELLLNALAYANSKLKDPQQIALINASIAEVLKNLTEDPELAYKQLELLSKAILAEDPTTVLEDAINQTRKDLASRNAPATAVDTEGLVFMDRLSKILQGSPIPVLSEDSIQSKLLVASKKIKDEDQISNEIEANLTELLNVFEEAISGMDETDNVNENEVADRVMDLNNEVMELGVAIQNDLKKSPPDQEELQKKLNDIKSKSLEVTGLTSLLASKRQELDKDTNEQLQDETSKVFESLKALEDAINSCKGSSNARNAQRQVQKANRELTSSLGALSDLIEAVIEKPPSTIDPSNNDYESFGNIAQNQLIKLSSLLQSCGSNISSNEFKRGIKSISKNLNDSLQKFHNAVGIVVKGTDEESSIMNQISDLEKLIKDNLSNPEKIDLSCPQEGYQLICDIRHAIGEALNTEVVAQPKAVSSLPFRYSVPVTQQAAPASTQELLPLIETTAKKAQDVLQSFTTVLNNAKSPADSITGSMSSFHNSVSGLIEQLDRMIASTWNPQSQNQLSQARAALIASADHSIDATRNRLLGSEGWRDDVSSFNGNAGDSIDQVIQAARKAFELAKADLSVTNEAERELVKAAQSVAESQKHLASMKSVAQEKKITSGEGYLGIDIIDISAPILSTAAKLIETAQAQTKFLLKRDPNLPNTKGLVKTAQDLVESLTLITVAAECTVNNEPDCISKVLAAANLVSSSAAHFLAEVYQKNGSPDLNSAMESITGSIQGLVKQLRAFGEAAQRQQSEKNAASAAPSTQKLSSMIQKLNAEAKVVEARRALEEAELKLKKTRLENK